MVVAADRDEHGETESATDLFGRVGEAGRRPSVAFGDTGCDHGGQRRVEYTAAECDEHGRPEQRGEIGVVLARVALLVEPGGGNRCSRGDEGSRGEGTHEAGCQ